MKNSQPDRPRANKDSMKRKLYIYLIGLILPGFLFAQAGRKQVLEGNAAYAEEKYDAAANAYQDALIEDPASPVIQFNMGAAQYQTSDYEKAMEAFNKSLDTDDPLLQSRAYYNMGNTFYRTQKLQEAIQSYEQALKLNPEDEDAKYNLEFVRNKLKENSQPQQNQPQDQQQQQQQDQQEQQQQDQQQQEQQQQEQNEEQEQQEQQEQQQQQAEERETEMSEEEAEQLLNALKEDQEDLQKKKAQAVGGGRAGKDW